MCIQKVGGCICDSVWKTVLPESATHLGGCNNKSSLYRYYGYGFYIIFLSTELNTLHSRLLTAWSLSGVWLVTKVTGRVESRNFVRLTRALWYNQENKYKNDRLQFNVFLCIRYTFTVTYMVSSRENNQLTHEASSVGSRSCRVCVLHCEIGNMKQ